MKFSLTECLKIFHYITSHTRLSTIETCLKSSFETILERNIEIFPYRMSQNIPSLPIKKYRFICLIWASHNRLSTIETCWKSSYKTILERNIEIFPYRMSQNIPSLPVKKYRFICLIWASHTRLSTIETCWKSSYETILERNIEIFPYRMSQNIPSLPIKKYRFICWIWASHTRLSTIETCLKSSFETILERNIEIFPYRMSQNIPLHYKSYSSFDHRDLLKVIIWNDLGAKYLNFPLQNVSKYSITLQVILVFRP